MMIPFSIILERLVLATLLGACIGATRISHLRSAGIGVHALMALGSALFMMIALFGFTNVPELGQTQGDPIRMLPWLLVGSALLGLSSLLRPEGRPTVAGLVTAATFWVGAVVGVLCGAGWLSEAVWGTLLTVSVLLLSSLVKRSFLSR